MELKLIKPSLWRHVSAVLADPRSSHVFWTGRSWLWLLGHSSDDIMLFGLGAKTWRYYPRSFFRYRTTLRTNKDVWPILHDKLFFDLFISKYLPTINIQSLLFDQQWGSGGVAGDGGAVGVDQKNDYVVYKPLRGGGGQGIRFIKSEGSRSKDSTSSEYAALFPKVRQCKLFQRIYPRTTNTLRITVFVDDHRRPRLLCPVARFGTSSSFPVDNFCKGGVLVRVDEEDGRLLTAMHRISNGSVREVREHPESGEEIAGVVPHWQDIRSRIIAFHERFPVFDLVGWDVLVADEEWFVIEGNHNPDLALPMVFSNFREEKGFSRFCAARGLI